jgi:hypothetical protein
MLRPSRLSIVVVMLLIFSAPSVFADTGTVHLSIAYNYRSVTYNTYVKWTSNMYGDVLNYGLGSDSHINFTNFSMGSASNPSWTFGVASQHGNVTITAIQPSYVRFSTATPKAVTLDVSFYYTTMPTSVYVSQPKNASIPSSSYYTTYSAWVAAASPVVYSNTSSRQLIVKSTAFAPVMQFSCSCGNGGSNGIKSGGALPLSVAGLALGTISSSQAQKTGGAGSLGAYMGDAWVQLGFILLAMTPLVLLEAKKLRK